MVKETSFQVFYRQLCHRMPEVIPSLVEGSRFNCNAMLEKEDDEVTLVSGMRMGARTGRGWGCNRGRYCCEVERNVNESTVHGSVVVWNS
jgi:hypothetical protein